CSRTRNAAGSGRSAPAAATAAARERSRYAAPATCPLARWARRVRVRPGSRCSLAQLQPVLVERERHEGGDVAPEPGDTVGALQVGHDVGERAHPVAAAQD